MKFAALEGHYNGKEGAGLVAVGILSSAKEDTGKRKINDFKFRIEIPKVLSFMAFGKFDAYVPGINDLVDGNPQRGILSVDEKIDRGRFARESLAQLKSAKDNNDTITYNAIKARFGSDEFREGYFRYFGYGFLNDPNSVIPNVPMAFYSFHLMVILGFYFLLLLALVLFYLFRDKLESNRFILRMSVFTIPLAYIASQAGWVLAETGRQPWVIQDLLPTLAAISHINASSVMVTFILFAVLFTALLIAELSIMFKQIKTGPK
jgi:cytochrome bd ubiquinol oxidase subunit I